MLAVSLEINRCQLICEQTLSGRQREELELTERDWDMLAFL